MAKLEIEKMKMTINEDLFDFLEVAQNSDKKQKGNDNNWLSLFCSGHCRGHQAKRRSDFKFLDLEAMVH